MTRTYLMLVLLLSSQLMLAGGGWVKSKGQGYYKFGQSWVESMGYFSGGSNFSPRLSSQLFTTSFYMEHGLGEGISLETYLPVYVRHTVDGMIEEDGELVVINDAIGGIGDMNVGLRKKIHSGSLIQISASLTLGLPIGSPTLGERENLFTGDGEFNQLIRSDLSIPFGNDAIAGYSTVYAGFNNRSGNFTNELWYGLEAGVSIQESKFWLIGRINAIEAGDTGEEQMFTNNFTQSMSFTNYMVETAIYLDPKIGLTASYTGSIRGNVLLVAPVYSLGLYMDIR
ncbi:MAG: hypothetical protein HKN79_02030 [Flavobacteriales bacterium]|nr:hypothetical protein [Flavobacteriales bacterium]